MANMRIVEQKAGNLTSIRFNPPLNMNAKELSAYLGISERKVRGDAAAGKIPSVRVGGRVIFRLKDIDSFLDRH